MSETSGKEALLGALKDEGFSSTLINRLAAMAELFEKDGDTFENFTKLDKHKLAGLYNRTSPDGSKGIGAKTYKAFDRLVYLAKMAKFDARQTAKAVVEEQERKEAEKARMREELLERELTAENILVALDILEKLGQKSFPLRDLIEFHDRAARAREG